MTNFLRFVIPLLLAWSGHAAGSVQQSVYQLAQTNNWVVAFIWTGDASSGSVPNTAAQLSGCCQGYLITQVETVPGSTAPTNGYSVAINDAAGVDALAGAAASLSSTTAQSFAASTSAPPVQGSFTLVITGQSVASAKGTVYVFLSKPGTVNLATLNRGGTTSSPNWLTIANPPFADARIYNFTPQSPGGNLAIGSNVITMRPMPPGITSASTTSGGVNRHFLYIVGGTGTAEAVPITAWTSGTVTVTCISAHTGNWTIQSASGGVQEAMEFAWANAMSVRYYGSAFNQTGSKFTNVNIYGPIYTPPGWGNTIDFRGVNFTVLLTSAWTSSDAWVIDSLDFSHYYIGNQIYWPSQPNGSAIFRLNPQLANGEALIGMATSTIEFGVIVPALANGAPGTSGYGIRISSLTPSSVTSGLNIHWQQINGGQYGLFLDNPTSTFGFNANTLSGYISGQGVANVQIGTSNAGSTLLYGNTWNFSGYTGTTAGFISYGQHDSFFGSLAGGAGDAFQFKAGSMSNAVHAAELAVGGSAFNNAGVGNRLFMGGATLRTTLSVGASPYIYQNLTGRTLTIFISGVSITSVGIGIDGSSFDSNTTIATNTFLSLPPDGWLKIIYSAGAPFVFTYY
jgi:hypothetical protein